MVHLIDQSTSCVPDCAVVNLCYKLYSKTSSNLWSETTMVEFCYRVMLGTGMGKVVREAVK